MKEKVVIITGASSGIGKACAEEFARCNAKIVIAARRIDKLENVAHTLSDKYNVDVLPVKTDVSIESNCRNLIEKSVEHFGRIDILINNAGVTMRALFTESKTEVIEKIMNINFWGTVYCTKYALPYLLRSKGSVVAVSSVTGYVGLPGRTAYAASKFAIHGFLESLRMENMKTGLHVLIAAPGFTASGIRKNAFLGDGSVQGETPLDESKLMQPLDVAKKIMNAIKKRKRRLILTRNGKLTVWLHPFFPRQIEKLLYNHLAKEPDSPFK